MDYHRIEVKIFSKCPISYLPKSFPQKTGPTKCSVLERIYPLKINGSFVLLPDFFSGGRATSLWNSLYS